MYFLQKVSPFLGDIFSVFVGDRVTFGVTMVSFILLFHESNHDLHDQFWLSGAPLRESRWANGFLKTWAVGGVVVIMETGVNWCLIDQFGTMKKNLPDPWWKIHHLLG